MDPNALSFLVSPSTFQSVYYEAKENDGIIDLGLSLRALQPETYHPSADCTFLLPPFFFFDLFYERYFKLLICRKRNSNLVQDWPTGQTHMCLCFFFLHCVHFCSGELGGI
nr:Aux/IAA protein [Eriobotrya japonica]